MPDGLSDSATITITSNDPAKGTINIPVAGKGLAGRLSVPRTLVIRSPGVGMQGQANLTLKNVGKGILTGSSPGPMPSPTFMEMGGGGGGGNAILPGQHQTLTITFTPTQTGTTLGSIQINVDPPSTGGTTVTLKGISK
jgi:hypothetical protein